MRNFRNKTFAAKSDEYTKGLVSFDKWSGSLNKKRTKGWLKHGDFIILDLIVMQLCFVLGFWLRSLTIQNPYAIDNYMQQAVALFVSQLVVVMFLNNYDGILRRRRFEELVAVLTYLSGTIIVLLVYLYIVHRSTELSRLMITITAGLFVVIDFPLRRLNRRRILNSNSRKNRYSLVLITSKNLVREALSKLTDTETFHNFFISSVILLDTDDTSGFDDLGVTVSPLSDETVAAVTHGWVDEAFILQPDFMPFPKDLMDKLMEMGITVSYTMSALIDDRWPVNEVKKLGKYKVISSGVKFATVGQLFLKRLMDIVGGLFGCIITGLLTIVIGPMIYSKSPGPIFFSQERIGKNGKKFRMYKFRSMYMDAEERKKELMAQNKVKDGMMFKMDDDPRIIGSEKKDKNGNPKGIGNFIRKTSIDEFPQFLNILKGDMSLVGTRPPTVDEWEKYDYAHRIRMSIKPGLTGMWQVSGRSEITDFDEVVALDKEYIETWSLSLDCVILIKTVLVVLQHKGAE